MKIFFLVMAMMTSLHAKVLQVMSYNVENLFDAKHDIVQGTDKNDWTFLPVDHPLKKVSCHREKSKHRKIECFSSDWNENKIKMRLSLLSEAIKGKGFLPDFLGLVEVENKNIVGRLAHKLGYKKFEITEGPDERGVDVALLYKDSKVIKKIAVIEHLVPLDFATRNILEVEFLINQKYPLTIFVNHWPSLSNPDSSRIKAAEILLSRSREIVKKNPQMAILALGDFNTIDENNPHPFKTVLYKDNFFLDVGESFLQDKSIDEKIKKNMSGGTYYYAPKDQWNYLDHFFVNRLLVDGNNLEVKIKSFEIFSPSFLVHELKKKVKAGEQVNYKIVKAPKRFNLKAKTKEKMGYSDHFPILVQIVYPDKSNKKKK